MFTAYSTQGQLKPRLILAEGFWDGLIQAAAYLGRESVRINALKRCPRLAEAVNDCCACSVFNYIPDLHGRETRVAVAGKWVLFTFTKWTMARAWRIEIHVKKEVCGVPQKKNKSCSSAASLRLRGHLDETTQRIAVESFMGVFAQVSQYFLWPINYLGTQHQSWLKRQFKMKKTVKKKKKTAFFTGQSQSFSFFARPSHCCEMQTQLPPNEAPKQTTSSLDRTCRELSREPFIRAVRV